MENEIQLLKVGAYTYGHEKIKIIHSNEGRILKIGKFCSIADNVTVFLGSNHRVDWISTYPFGHINQNTFDKIKLPNGHPSTKGDVIIGNDVWIATNSVIMSGVKIGDGAVVAANAVVTKDVSPYSIVAGNPAKEVKKRFDDQTVKKLLKIKWWDFDENKINDISDILLSSDIKKLITKIYEAE